MMRLLFDQQQYKYQKINGDTAVNVSELGLLKFQYLL
jgi:hypothetical protein